MMMLLKVGSVAAWSLAIVTMLLGVVRQDEHWEHVSLLFGLAGVGLLGALAIRWGSGMLVYVLALYNHDLPTPESRTHLERLLVDIERDVTPIEQDGASSARHKTPSED